LGVFLFAFVFSKCVTTKKQSGVFYDSRSSSKGFGIPCVLVSHDLSEVYKFAQQVIVLENGAISRRGMPDEVFNEKRLSGKIQFAGNILKIGKEGFFIA
jgi:ABC-type sulfate/molybdate transport systems ATPase subunit